MDHDFARDWRCGDGRRAKKQEGGRGHTKAARATEYIESTEQRKSGRRWRCWRESGLERGGSVEERSKK